MLLYRRSLIRPLVGVSSVQADRVFTGLRRCVPSGPVVHRLATWSDVSNDGTVRVVRVMEKFTEYAESGCDHAISDISLLCRGLPLSPTKVEYRAMTRSVVGQSSHGPLVVDKYRGGRVDAILDVIDPSEPQTQPRSRPQAGVHPECGSTRYGDRPENDIAINVKSTDDDLSGCGPSVNRPPTTGHRRTAAKDVESISTDYRGDGIVFPARPLGSREITSETRDESDVEDCGEDVVPRPSDYPWPTVISVKERGNVSATGALATEQETTKQDTAGQGPTDAGNEITFPVPANVLLTYRKKDSGDDDGPPDDFTSRLRSDVRRHFRIARAVGIEAVVGQMMRVVEKDAELPCARSAEFTTAEPARRVGVYYGDCDRPADNVLLGLLLTYRPPGYDDGRAARTVVRVTAVIAVDASGAVTARCACTAHVWPDDVAAYSLPANVSLTYRDRDDGLGGRRFRMPGAVGVEPRHGVMLRVVEKDAELPCARTAGFATNNPLQRVGVYYGDGGRPADNALLGTVAVYRPPGYEVARARSPRTVIAVTVRVSVDTSGLVTVRRECAVRERPDRVDGEHGLDDDDDDDDDADEPWPVPSVPSCARHPGHSFAHTGALSVTRFEFQPLCLVCDPELRCRTHRHVEPLKRSLKKCLSFVFNAVCVCAYFHWLRAERALVDVFGLIFFGYHEVEFTRSEQAFVEPFPYDNTTYDLLTGQILPPFNDTV